MLVRNAAYVLPFALSATAVAGLAALLGRLWPGGVGVSRWVQVAILLFLAACDLRLGPLRTPAVYRQTKPEWRWRVGLTRATALWGLDIGTTVSTIKVTSLYWASLVLLLRLPHPPFQLAVGCFAVGYLLAHLGAVGVGLSGRAAELPVLAAAATTAIRLSSAAVLLIVGVLIGLDAVG